MRTNSSEIEYHYDDSPQSSPRNLPPLENDSGSTDSFDGLKSIFDEQPQEIAIDMPIPPKETTHLLSTPSLGLINQKQAYDLTWANLKTIMNIAEPSVTIGVGGITSLINIGFLAYAFSTQTEMLDNPAWNMTLDGLGISLSTLQLVFAIIYATAKQKEQDEITQNQSELIHEAIKFDRNFWKNILKKNTNTLPNFQHLDIISDKVLSPQRVIICLLSLVAPALMALSFASSILELTTSHSNPYLTLMLRYLGVLANLSMLGVRTCSKIYSASATRLKNDELENILKSIVENDMACLSAILLALSDEISCKNELERPPLLKPVSNKSVNAHLIRLRAATREKCDNILEEFRTEETKTVADQETLAAERQALKAECCTLLTSYANLSSKLVTLSESIDRSKDMAVEQRQAHQDERDARALHTVRIQQLAAAVKDTPPNQPLDMLKEIQHAMKPLGKEVSQIHQLVKEQNKRLTAQEKKLKKLKENIPVKIENALAAERQRSEKTLSDTLATERQRSEQTLSDTLATERQQAEQTLSDTLATERQRAEQTLSDTLATERQQAEEKLQKALAEERKAIMLDVQAMLQHRDNPSDHTTPARTMARIGAFPAPKAEATNPPEQEVKRQHSSHP